MKKNLFVKSLIVFGLLAVTFVESTAADKDRLSPLLSGVPSLTITPDARSGGMGDVGAATSADINSQFWNPSKYPFMESKGGAGFSFTPWMSSIVSDINLAYLSGYRKIDDKQSVSASLRYFSLGQIDLTGIDGQDQGSTNPNEYAIDIAYSRLLAENWSAAVALRYIRSDLGGGMVEGMKAGNSVAADIAATYMTKIDLPQEEGNFAIGLNISNIGQKIAYDDTQSLFLPTNMRLGGSFDYPIDRFNKLSVSLDLNKLLVPATPLQSDFLDINGDNDVTAFEAAKSEYDNTSVISGIFDSFSDSEEFQEIAWAMGAEYGYNDQFFVRGGYFWEHPNKGNRKFFTVGAGFKLNMFKLDAAYIISTAQTSPLDKTLRFSLSFDMEGLKDLAR